MAAPPGRAGPRRARGLGRRLRGDRRVRRVVRPRRRPAVHPRHPRRDVRAAAGADPRGLRRRPRVGGAARGVAGRTAVLRQPPAPAGAARGADPDRRPAPLVALRRAHADRRTPARDADRAARPRRPDRAAARRRAGDGGRAAQGASSRCASGAAPASGWSTGRWRAATTPRRSRCTCASRSSPLVRVLRHEHCPWRHDYGLRYLDEDLPPDVAARVAGAGARRRRRRPAAQSADCFAWLDELLDGPDAARTASGASPAVRAAVPHRGREATRNHTPSPIRISGRWVTTVTASSTASSTTSGTGSPRNRRGAAGAVARPSRAAASPGRRGRPGQVREDRAELAAGPGRPDPVEPLGVLLDGQPALGVVLAELGGGPVALGVAHPQVRVAHGRLPLALARSSPWSPSASRP